MRSLFSAIKCRRTGLFPVLSFFRYQRTSYFKRRMYNTEILSGTSHFKETLSPFKNEVAPGIQWNARVKLTNGFTRYHSRKNHIYFYLDSLKTITVDITAFTTNRHYKVHFPTSRPNTAVRIMPLMVLSPLLFFLSAFSSNLLMASK